MGVSLLYHLAKRGWQDLALLEKNQLTAGSTWHAAGLCTHFAHSPTIMEMRATSVRLYRDILPAETGTDVGFHACGALRITRSEERMREFMQVQGLGEFTGYRFDLLTPEQLKEIYPLTTLDGIVGAIHEPDDGHVDPTLATNAMAERARAMGASIYRQCPVRKIDRTEKGWVLSTEQGEIIADQIVNAAGTWCREIGDMMGVDLPVVPMLHQYLVTDSIPEIQQRIADGQPELPMIRDPEESWYLRQERDGYIVGPYESDGQPWSVDGVPEAFGMELLPPDLERIEHILEKAMQRVPALETAGLKTTVNGPITFTPDANPLVGPAFGLDKAWLLTGSSMGVMEGGGAGSFLADWITNGSPPMDALAIDSRRFGDFADRDYRLDKAVEGFGLQFGVHFPFEERPASRQKRLTPLYDLQHSQSAVFGCAYGWERPNYFLTPDAPTEPDLTFLRPGWFDCVGNECRHVSEAAGIADMSVFSKFEIKGPDADNFLQTLGSNAPPSRDGRVGLTHVLTEAGGVASEFSVLRIAQNHYYLNSAAAAQRHDHDLLRCRSAAFDIQLTDVTVKQGVLALMGPEAEKLLQQVCEISLSHQDFPWLSSQNISVGGITLLALRVSYIGESGFELHMPLNKLKQVYDVIHSVANSFDLRPYGAYAMNSMRLEKGYRAWGMDLTTERTPIESGLSYLVKNEQREFVGREALIKRSQLDSDWRMVLLELDTDGDREPFASHSVFSADEAVGIITSAAFGHRTAKRLALAYLKPSAFSEQHFSVRVLDRMLDAQVLNSPPYDAQNLRMRGR